MSKELSLAQADRLLKAAFEPGPDTHDLAPGVIGLLMREPAAQQLVVAAVLSSLGMEGEYRLEVSARLVRVPPGAQ